MKSYNNLYKDFCSMDNLILAHKKARKKKTLKPYVIEFEQDLDDNLRSLQAELCLLSYRPKPLVTFIIRDPKTRKISKSDFRDRIVHHALCNIIEPIFEKQFITDSYANRKGKGTLKAIQTYDKYKRKVSHNGKTIKNPKSKSEVKGWCLKADIYHYFDEVNHNKLLQILGKKIKDTRILHIIKIILQNHNLKEPGVGMPLGNLTSQFFANVYLNGLDQYVKHKLKTKYYIRYVDDFVILHRNPHILEEYKKQIDEFLKDKLHLQLHPQKTKILPLKKGIDFLGFRNFYHHRLLRERNLRNMKKTFCNLSGLFKEGLIDGERMEAYVQGWLAYAKNANTFKLREELRKQHMNLFLS